MLGQHIEPEVFEPILSGIPISNIQRSLYSMNNAMKQAVSRMPYHGEFILKYTNGVNS